MHVMDRLVLRVRWEPPEGFEQSNAQFNFHNHQCSLCMRSMLHMNTREMGEGVSHWREVIEARNELEMIAIIQR